MTKVRERERKTIKYTITVPGKAVAFKRPRFNARSKKVFNEGGYTIYKNLVRGHAARVVDQRLNGSIHAEIDVYMPIPASWSKVKKERARTGEERPTKKPDIDNYIKTFFDACNEIFYDDDDQIISVAARKFYSDEPRVTVTFEEIGVS